MKIAVSCESPLLQKTLETFLAPYLCSLKQSELIVSDKKIVHSSKKNIYISSGSDADLIKPFSKSQLMQAIENMLDKRDNIQKVNEIMNEMDNDFSHQYDNRDFSILEKRIEMLTREYQNNILKTVRAFYEK